MFRRPSNSILLAALGRNVSSSGTNSSARTRGNPVGDLGFIDVTQAPAVPRHLLRLFRLEQQKHIKNDTTRTRQYALCTKCGVSNCVINFDQVPSARVGMYGVCSGNKDYTHHNYKVLTQQQYQMLQNKSPKERLQWLFQES